MKSSLYLEGDEHTHTDIPPPSPQRGYDPELRRNAVVMLHMPIAWAFWPLERAAFLPGALGLGYSVSTLPPQYEQYIHATKVYSWVSK